MKSINRSKEVFNQFLVSLLIKLVRFYQVYISPQTLPSCRFLPSCSEYTIQALQQKGLVEGSFLSLKRILSCHPFRTSKTDEVPK